MSSHYLRTLSLSVVILAFCGACSGGDTPPPKGPTPVEQLPIPDDFVGPIDPEWPPSHPADLEVELRAGRLLRERQDQGERVNPRETLFEGDYSNVYASQGRIGNFDYIESIVGDVESIDDELPLVVLLHGRGGRPSIPYAGMAGDPPVRVFSPRAPDRLGKSGFTWFATWTTSGQTELLARSIVGRADELAPAIQAYSKLRPTRGKPIVAGFSQGGILTYALVTRYPHLFAAAFPVAGWIPEANLPQPPKKGSAHPLIHAMHGTSDETVPFADGRATVEALGRLGITVELTAVPGVAHEVTPEMGQSVRGWIGNVLFPGQPTIRRANSR
jgi:phospholipase/carboxylesterase